MGEIIVPLKEIEYGFGYIVIRSPYTPHSIYLRGIVYAVKATISWGVLSFTQGMWYKHLFVSTEQQEQQRLAKNFWVVLG